MYKNAKDYKELLVIKHYKTHIYLFEYKSERGHYVIDQNDKFWIQSSFLKDVNTEGRKNLNKKVFDITKNEQDIFVDLYDYSKNYGCKPKTGFKSLFEIILANSRQGTPRKFIKDENGERVNIKIPTYTLEETLNL